MCLHSCERLEGELYARTTKNEGLEWKLVALEHYCKGKFFPLGDAKVLMARLFKFK